MGWGDCGTDDDGRPIGYIHKAICDHPECEAEIHRGLAYACGGFHLGSDKCCHKYFCGDHLYFTEESHDDIHGCVCAECVTEIDALETDQR